MNEKKEIVLRLIVWLVLVTGVFFIGIWKNLGWGMSLFISCLVLFFGMPILDTSSTPKSSGKGSGRPPSLDISGIPYDDD